MNPVGLKQVTFEAPADLLDAVGEVLEHVTECPPVEVPVEKLIVNLVTCCEALRYAAPEEWRDEVLKLASVSLAALAGLNSEQLDDVIMSIASVRSFFERGPNS